MKLENFANNNQIITKFYEEEIFSKFELEEQNFELISIFCSNSQNSFRL